MTIKPRQFQCGLVRISSTVAEETLPAKTEPADGFGHLSLWFGMEEVADVPELVRLPRHGSDQFLMAMPQQRAAEPRE